MPTPFSVCPFPPPPPPSHYSSVQDRSVQFWDPRRIVAGGTLAADEGPVLILQGHQNSVISVAHSPAALLFATGSGLSSPLAPPPPPFL